ncbi:type II toxin-antitoxin system HicB family antitoxin [Candidatus Saganbacteria bacterium]|nr:type II toxin-antitoxin system HicB family antitoxin [Candidatus Saganbacteria bacterium]
MTYNFTVIMEPEIEGGYHVYCPSLAGGHSFGDTVEEAKNNIKEAIEAFIESLKKSGEPIPLENDLLIGEIKLELSMS